jgi:hypothetical protein
MRAVYSAALCFILGACATFGGGEPDPYGIYDIVTINGEALPTMEVISGWCELRPDGTDWCSMTVEGLDEPIEGSSPHSLGEFEDGCFRYESTDEEGGLWTGSICDETITATNGEMTVVLHRRQ